MLKTLENLLSMYQDREKDLTGTINDMKAKNTGARSLLVYRESWILQPP